MGYIRHHAIVLTGGDYRRDQLEQARAKAVELGCAVSEIVASPINGYLSFFVAPDGSKEGWEGSEEGWRARCSLIEWVRGQYYVDGGSSIDWVEVQYGDDDGRTWATRSSDADAEGVPDVEEVY